MGETGCVKVNDGSHNDLGADDYLVNPFILEILLARVGAIDMGAAGRLSSARVIHEQLKMPSPTL